MTFLSKLTLTLTPEIWKAGLRAAAASGIAYGLSEALSLHQGEWAVITAIVIMQANLGASLQAAGERLLGTLIGAAFGFAVAYLTPSTNFGTLLALLFATGLLSMLAMRNPAFRIAPVTAAILLISSPSHADASISALSRVIEISLGCFIGIAVSLLVAPSRAEARLRVEASRALGLLGQFVVAEMQGPEGKSDDDAIATTVEDIYAAYRNIDKLVKETDEEHASHLARGDLDVSRLRTCLRQLRTTIVYIGHVTRPTWPPEFGDILVAPAQAVATVTHDYLLALGRALVAGEAPPTLDELDATFATFASAAEAAARQAHTATHAPGTDETQHATGNHVAAFVLAFSVALEQVRISIKELAECVKEMSDATDPS